VPNGPLTPCEEAFIWFVVLLDIIPYHSYSLMPSLEKDAILEFIETYTEHGVEMIQPYPFNYHTPFKGYHTKDILLFMIVQKQVLAEQNNQKAVVSPDISLPSGNPPTTGVLPFTFSLLELIACINLEPSDYDSSKKQKLLLVGASSRVSPSMAMEFDDGDVCFDYTNAAHITLHGV
jgi:hypothetical protein